MPRHYLKDFFQFTRGERTGTLVLFVLLLGLIALRIRMPDEKPVPAIDFSAYNREIQGLLKPDSAPRTLSQYSKKNTRIRPGLNPGLSLFDPNKVSKKDLEKMGISGKPAYTWLKYLEKGGQFRRKEDLKKIYGMEDSVYYALEKYVQIVLPGPADPVKSPKELLDSSEADSFFIELNQVDSAGLCRVGGLNPVLSGRVIRYRNWLGGFYKPAQLLEVYGFSEATFSRLKNRFRTDSLALRKMNLNRISRHRLAGHPYLNSYQAGAIVKYRELKGAYTSVSEVLQNHLIPEKVYELVKPYLQVPPDSLKTTCIKPEPGKKDR